MDKNERVVKPYKAKKVKLDKKYSMIVYIAVLVVAVLARTLQLQSNMNFYTGKYIDDSFAKNYPVGVIIIGCILLLLVLTLGESRDKAIKSCILINPMRLRYDRLNKKISPKVGAVCLVMAFLVLFDVFLDLSYVVNKNQELSTDDNHVFAFAGMSVLSVFVYVCAIISMITFISMGTNILKGEGISRGNCVFLSSYAIWKLLQIFDMIGNDELISATSEKVYIMLTAMLSAAFFLCAAKFFGGFEKKRTRIILCMLAYMSSIMAAVSTVPRYIIYFTKNYMERDGMDTPSTADVGIIIITVALITVFWGTYVYRVMPKLNLGNSRRWSKTTVVVRKTNMRSIEEDLKDIKK
ncbi:MAG: hypothetical protein J1F11_04755 [Oscillospiraceae bacterium]|nr:hypothetical protein [Oscillospiraceae bacterium]